MNMSAQMNMCMRLCKWSKLGSNCRGGQLADFRCRVSGGAGSRLSYRSGSRLSSR